MDRLQKILAAKFRRPDPAAKNNYLVIVFDSCRFDAFAKANPVNMMRLGPLQKRYSYCSWTAPSHYNLLMGLLPHPSPRGVFASEHYREDFLRYNERLGAKGIEFAKLVPTLYLPTYLRRELGYYTHARVSLPVLNPATILNRDFDQFDLMDQHNDMAAMLPTLQFSEARPSYFLLNVGETHYPYAIPGEDPEDWPKIHGVHGIFKELGEGHCGGGLLTEDSAPAFFNQSRLDECFARQVRAVQYLDQVFERLADLCPKNTYITITSDHGELFGEDGYFGHGPIMHEKVFEVPFIEGQLR